MFQKTFDCRDLSLRESVGNITYNSLVKFMLCSDFCSSCSWLDLEANTVYWYLLERLTEFVLVRRIFLELLLFSKL